MICNKCNYEWRSISCFFKPLKPFFRPEHYHQIVTVVCHVTGLTELQIRGNGRKREMIEARYIAVDLIRVMHPDLDQETIAKVFKYADHSMVCYIKKQVENLRATNEKFRAKYLQIADTVNKNIRRPLE